MNQVRNLIIKCKTNMTATELLKAVFFYAFNLYTIFINFLITLSVLILCAGI